MLNILILVYSTGLELIFTTIINMSVSSLLKNTIGYVHVIKKHKLRLITLGITAHHHFWANHITGTFLGKL